MDGANETLSFLSHFLDTNTPGYGGSPGFDRSSLKSICDGGSCNQESWVINNHIGTHVDAPFHFCAEGEKVTDVEPSFWFFSKPCLIDINLEEGDLISPEHIASLVSEDSDLLLIRTGFEQYREESRYWAKNPGLSPELGTWLRSERPSLRMIGMDFISITSYLHRDLGKKAHRAVLAKEGPGKAIWAIEDMKLAHLKHSPNEVTVAPLLVNNADGGPVTVFAKGGL